MLLEIHALERLFRTRFLNMSIHNNNNDNNSNNNNNIIIIIFLIIILFDLVYAILAMLSELLKNLQMQMNLIIGTNSCHKQKEKEKEKTKEIW